MAKGWSLRARITTAATVLAAALLATIAIALVGVQRRELVANLDHTLEVRADSLLADYARNPTDAFASSNDEDRLAQLVTTNGTVLAATPNLDGAAPLHGGDAVDYQIVRTVHDLPIEDDSFRLLSRPVDTIAGPAVLHVAENVDDLNDSIRILTTSLLVTLPLATIVLAALVWWLVGRTLRPVEAIRAEVADIGGSGLDRRVPVPSTADEVARLATTMNAMLDRIAESTQRQRRFTADASHELRSPLTRIRTHLELDLAHHGERDIDGTLRELLAETVALQRLVDDLLQLARADETSTVWRSEPIDLDDIVLREARRARAAGHSLDLGRVSAALVLGDPDQLSRLVRNLLDNATRHARTHVAITLSESDGIASLVIDDDGPGIPEADRRRVFERFTRLDHARTAGRGGTGLGLAIAYDIVVRHTGTIQVADNPDGGARLEVKLPALR